MSEESRERLAKIVNEALAPLVYPNVLYLNSLNFWSAVTNCPVSIGITWGHKEFALTFIPDVVLRRGRLSDEEILDFLSSGMPRLRAIAKLVRAREARGEQNEQT